MSSALNRNGAASAPTIVFLSPDQLRARRPPTVRWIWEGYAARGALTLLAGKPKVGKSTLACALAEAVAADAGQFLGRPVKGGPVIYVTEEGTATALQKLRHPALRVLTREDAWPRPSWKLLLEAAAVEAQRIGAVLIVIDTFAMWAGLGVEREKDAGAVQEAIALLGALGPDLGIVLVHHQRKGGGEDGDAVRGSNALTGAVDAIVEYERPPGEAPARQRQIVAVSRWPQTPPLLLVEPDSAKGAWRVVGEGTGRDDARPLAWRERLARAVPDVEPGVTLKELETIVGASKQKWHPALTELIEGGVVRRTGAGKKGDPYRHWRPSSETVPESRPGRGTETAGGVNDAIPSLPSVSRRERQDGMQSSGVRRDSVRDGFDDDDATLVEWAELVSERYPEVVSEEGAS